MADTGIEWCTEFAQVSRTGIDIAPNLTKCPIPVWKSVPVAAGYRYLCRTEHSNVSGKDADVVPNYSKSPVPVIPAVYTATVPSTPFTMFWLWGDFDMGENTSCFVFDWGWVRYRMNTSMTMVAAVELACDICV